MILWVDRAPWGVSLADIGWVTHSPALIQQLGWPGLVGHICLHVALLATWIFI